MNKSAMIAVFVLALQIAPLAAQEKVMVGGSGSLTEDMAELAKAYMTKNPSDSIHVLMEA